MSPQQAMEDRDRNRVPYVVEDVLLSTGAMLPGPMKVLRCGDQWLEVYAAEKVRIVAWAHIVHITLRNT